MTIGRPRKVLSDLASLIAGEESGVVTVSWSTAHGHRVVELLPATVHLIPQASGVSAEDRPVQDPPAKSTDAPAPAPTSPGEFAATLARFWGRACVDAWQTAFPPRGQKGRQQR